MPNASPQGWVHGVSREGQTMVLADEVHCRTIFVHTNYFKEIVILVSTISSSGHRDVTVLVSV